MTHALRQPVAGVLALAILIAGHAAQSAEPVRPAAQPFPLTAVRLLDGPFAEAQQRNCEVLLQLDPDRLLHMFRVKAGLPSQAEALRRLGGARGRSARPLARALPVRLCADVCRHGRRAIQGARAAHRRRVWPSARRRLPQQATHPGYLAAFPESFFDRVETGKPVWVPWYTLHKIMAGLLDTYQLLRQPAGAGRAAASGRLGQVPRGSAVARAAASHARHRVRRHERSAGQSLRGHRQPRAPAAGQGLRSSTSSSIRWPQGEDRLDGLHANTQIPKIIGAAREYEVTGEPRYRDIAKCFWDRVALHRSYVIGGHSDREHFFPLDRVRQASQPGDRRDLQHLQHAEAHAAPVRAGAVGRDDGLLRAGAVQPHPRVAGPGAAACSSISCRSSRGISRATPRWTIRSGAASAPAWRTTPSTATRSSRTATTRCT